MEEGWPEPEFLHLQINKSTNHPIIKYLAEPSCASAPAGKPESSSWNYEIAKSLKNLTY
jgi:hypothetical protein